MHSFNIVWYRYNPPSGRRDPDKARYYITDEMPECHALLKKSLQPLVQILVSE